MTKSRNITDIPMEMKKDSTTRSAMTINIVGQLILGFAHYKSLWHIYTNQYDNEPGQRLRSW